MTATILVATPHTAFGELLRVSLVDSGQYQVELVPSAKEARAWSQQNSIHLVILDAALNDEPFVPLCMDILKKQPGVRLVIIPPDNNPNHPALGGLLPHGYLSRPFYLPDLTTTVTRLLADRERQFQAQTLMSTGAPLQPARASAPVPAWLKEPLTLRSSLAKELSATRAVAAVAGISTQDSSGNNAMRATAGSLSNAAAQELTNVVFRYWSKTEKTDLMRFVRLSEDKKDYLVYATQVAGELVLIMAYETTAPLSVVRPQTRAMAQALASVQPKDAQAEPSGSNVSQEPNREDEAAEAVPVSEEPGVEPPVLEPQVESAVDWSFSERPADSADSAAESLAASEPETQPLEDNIFYNRLYNSFATQTGSAASSLPHEEISGASTSQPGVQEPAEQAAMAGDFQFLSELAQNEDEESEGGEVINLSALLGSVPPPDPVNNERQKPLFGADWFSERSANTPIPTLSGGLNGSTAGNNATAGNASVPLWERPADNDMGDTPAQLAEKEENGQASDQPKKKAARTAPLDPQTMPRDSLPPEPALPVDYALPVNDYPLDIQEDDFLQAVSGRPASMEVKTEPPVTPPGVPSAIEPRQTDALTEPPVNIVEDTHPNLVSTITSLEQLEPSSPALSLLNYTCVLVPRLPQHYLTGELADRLAGWVQQLCLAFGWRLEGISIRPEYLQWTVQVAPAISPGNLVRIVRQRTSLHIFGSYPHLAEQNPSGDFWANGYLIVSGAQPPSAQLLRDYIAQTRKRQGVNK